MKINKILAAGIAATLAVTSLSAVTASAETTSKDYELWTTTQTTNEGTVTLAGKLTKDIGVNIKQAVNKRIVLSNLTTELNDGYQWAITGVHMQVKGYKLSSNGTNQTATPVDETFDFINNASTGYAWAIVAVNDQEPVKRTGEFASGFYDEITDINFTFTVRAGTTDVEGPKTVAGTYAYLKNNHQVNGVPVNQVKIGAVRIQTYDTVNKAWVTDTTGGLKDGIVGGATADTANAVYTASKNKIALEAGTDAPADVNVTAAIIAKTAKPAADSTVALGTKTYTAGTALKSYTTADPTNAGDATAAGAVAAGATAAAAATVILDGTVTENVVIYTATADIKNGNNDTVVAQNGKFTVNGTTFKILNAGDDAAVYDEDATSEFDATTYEGYTFTVDDEPAAVTAAANAYYIKSADGTYTKGTQNLWTIDATGKGEATEGTNEAAYLIAFAAADGGWFPSRYNFGDLLTDVNYYNLTFTQGQHYAWLPVTTWWIDDNKTGDKIYDVAWKIEEWNAARDYWLANKAISDANVGAPPRYVAFVGHDGTTTITRRLVRELSHTGATTSTQGAIGNADGDQTYVDEMTNGTNPSGFSGLASQVANFFNKQNNGTITFTFTSNSASGSSSAWSSGIPSTEVGLIGSGAGTVSSNFALFFNYASTGGVSLTQTKTDLATGSVEFDLKDYLDDCGGLTKQTLHDIYYGLNVGYEKDYSGSGNWGMYVSKVTLAYDDAAAATDADATDATDVSADDDDDDNQDIVADDDDDDDDDDFADDDDDDDDDTWADDTDDDDEGFDDDDDDASLEDDTNDDDDTNVANDTNVTNGDDEASDGNPETGAGLAVIPAIVAAAAVAVSKKRK